MSVYTSVNEAELNAFLTQYDVGDLVHFEGISAGIENTNYFVDTEKAGQKLRFVLTLFETYSFEEMPYFLGLMKHLADNGVTTASPIISNSGELLLQLNGKPAALVERLDGGDVDTPNIHQISAIGKAMAEMHIAGQSYENNRPNCRSFSWWEMAIEKLEGHLPEEDTDLIRDEIAYQNDIDRSALPSGIIHADLFHDNALFKGDSLAGIIDFYFACNDVFLYDIAVTLNDWCSDDDGSLNQEKSLAFLRSYQSERQLTDLEQEAFTAMLRAGALRFWMSRLMDYHFPREGEMTHTKDPNQFKNILKQRILAETELNKLIA